MPLPVSLAEGTTLLKGTMGLLLSGNLFHPPMDGQNEAQLLLRLLLSGGHHLDRTPLLLQSGEREPDEGA